MTPLLAFSEGFAVSCGLLQGLLAFLLWVHHRNRPQWGLNWMGAAMLFGAIINLAAPALITRAVQSSPEATLARTTGLLTLMVGFAAISALLVGLRSYCLATRAQPLVVFASFWLGSQALVIATAGWGVWYMADLIAAATFIYGACLCWRASRREPGIGHRLLAAALLAHPACLALLFALGLDPRAARYGSAVPYTIIGLVLLSVSLVRLRTELGAELSRRRVAEEDLCASQALLANTFDLLPEPLAQIDADSGHYIDVNRMWVKRMGIARDEAIGRTSLALGLWNDPDERTALRERLQSKGHVENVPIVYRTPDGGSVACEVSATNLVVGNRRVGLWLTRDVTQRRRDEEAMRASENRFRQLFELAPVSMAFIEPGGRCSMVNRHWMQLIGYGPEMMPTPQAWWELACPDAEYRAAARQEWESHLRYSSSAGTEVELMEKDIRCADGRVRTLLFGGADVGNGFVVSAHDLTERKRLESELRQLAADLEERVRSRTQELVRSEKLASLGALVAGVAHELNTPIGNANMVASTLAGRQREFEAGMVDGLRRSALQKFLQEVRDIEVVLGRNLHRAAELIASFKQLAVDQSSDQRRRFAVADVIREVLLALSPTLKRSQVETVVDVAPGLTMNSYPGPLGQALMNLVNNSVVHAFEAVSNRRIEIQAWADGPGRAVLVVRDNGCGVPSENLPRLFDPFFTTRMGHGGSGLGLHIVHNIVTGPLRGRIDVSSHRGEGTCFRLELPLETMAPQMRDTSPGSEPAMSAEPTP